MSSNSPSIWLDMVTSDKYLENTLGVDLYPDIVVICNTMTHITQLLDFKSRVGNVVAGFGNTVNRRNCIELFAPLRAKQFGQFHLEKNQH